VTHKQRRLKHLETKIKAPSQSEKIIEFLVSKINLKKSVLKQVQKSVSVDVVETLISRCRDLRNPVIQELHKRDIDTLTDAELLLCINGSDEFILEDEMLFLNAYKKAFDIKFYSTESEAIKNYLEMIQNDKQMLLDISLSEFDYGS